MIWVFCVLFVKCVLEYTPFHVQLIQDSYGGGCTEEWWVGRGREEIMGLISVSKITENGQLKCTIEW